MSNVTPPAPAGLDRLTVNVNVVVPESPSACVTSLIVRLGVVEHVFSAVALLRGATPAAAKSAALSSVSVQPAPARKSEVVALIVGAAAAPSKKLAPVVPVP